MIPRDERRDPDFEESRRDPPPPVADWPCVLALLSIVAFLGVLMRLAWTLIDYFAP